MEWLPRYIEVTTLHGNGAAPLADFKTWRPGFGYDYPYPGSVVPSFSGPLGYGRVGRTPAYGPQQAADAPRIDLIESQRAYEVTAELPGLAAEDVEVVLDGDVLTIRGEKRGEPPGGAGATTSPSAASARSTGRSPFRRRSMRPGSRRGSATAC